MYIYSMFTLPADDVKMRPMIFHPMDGMPSRPEAEALQQWICARNDAAAIHLYPDVLPCLDSWIACWNVCMVWFSWYIYI